MTYFNGSLHLPIEYEKVLSVDPKDKDHSWKVTEVRYCDNDHYREGPGYVGQSQGRLIYANNSGVEDDVLSIFVRDEDQNSSMEWIMKHNLIKYDILFEPMEPPIQSNPVRSWISFGW
jgi:hypothetical protein